MRFVGQRCATRPSRRSRRPGPGLEPLESRTLLSGFTPVQIRHGYGFDQVSYTGAGQTIAIVDAYDDPNIAGDLATFDSQYGLPAPPSFTKVNQTGDTTYPVQDKGWDTEIALDVEWAHAVAPGANLLLVEANSANDTDLLAAVDYAAAHAQVVSMSWGGGEFSGETSSSYEGHFAGKSGVTFVASSGDYGKPPSWPAISPSVLSVGGTNLKLTSTNTWSSETGWGNGSWSFFLGGSGGGISQYFAQPSYQKGVVTQSTTKRTNPDVAYDADPNTGVNVYDSVNGGWMVVGGTSAGSPQWAALLALADEGRAAAGKTALGFTQTLPAIYQMTAGNFHDITSGNNGYAAGAGYDLVTGRGSPKAASVINDLVSSVASAAAVAPLTQASPVAPTDHAVAITLRPLFALAQPVVPPPATAAGPAASVSFAASAIQVPVRAASPTGLVPGSRVDSATVKLTPVAVEDGGEAPVPAPADSDRPDSLPPAEAVPVVAPPVVPALAPTTSGWLPEETIPVTFTDAGASSTDYAEPARAMMDPVTSAAGVAMLLGGYWGAQAREPESQRRLLPR